VEFLVVRAVFTGNMKDSENCHLDGIFDVYIQEINFRGYLRV